LEIMEEIWIFRQVFL